MKNIFKCLVFVFIIGLFTGLGACDSPYVTGNDLSFDCEEISINVGETKEIIYTCSKSDTIISFTSDNTNVASVNCENSNWQVVGVASGETILQANVVYSDLRIVKRVKVVVLDKSKENSGVIEDESKIYDISLNNYSNCSYDKETKTLHILDIEKQTFFTLYASDKTSFEVNDFSSSSNDLVLMQKDDSYLTFDLKVKILGSWTITFILDEGYEFVINVVCE